jgi:hypothetical protein
MISIRAHEELEMQIVNTDARRRATKKPLFSTLRLVGVSRGARIFAFDSPCDVARWDETVFGKERQARRSAQLTIYQSNSGS